MDMNDLAKSLFNSKRAEGASNVSNAKTVQGTVVEDSEDGSVKVVIDGDVIAADGTNEVEIGTVASLKEGDETIILLEGGGVMRPTAIGSVGWGDRIQAEIVETNLLVADKADIDDLEAAVGRIGTLETNALTAESATITSLQAAAAKLDNLTAAQLEAANAYISALTAGSVTASDIIADKAKLNGLTAEQLSAATAYIGALTTGNVTAANLIADHGDFATVKANAAKVANLTAAQLEADHATVGSLSTNYAQIDAANITQSTTQNAWVDKLLVQTGLIANDGAIFTLDAIKVNAANITAGTLDVERLVVTDSSTGEKHLVTWNSSTQSYDSVKLDGGVLEDRTIAADKLVANSITVSEITTQNLAGTGGWINLASGTFSYGTAPSGEGISWDGSHLVIKANSISLSSGGSVATKTEMYENAQPNLTPFFDSHNSDNTYPNGGVGGYWQISSDKKYNRTGFTALGDGWAHVAVSSTTHHEFVPPMVDGLVSGNRVTMLVEWRNASITGNGANFYTRNYATNLQLPTNWYFGPSMNTASGEARKTFTVSSANGQQTWNGLVDVTFTCKDTSSTFEGDVRISFYKEAYDSSTSSYIQYAGPWKPYSGNLLYASQAELKVANDNIALKVSESDVTGNYLVGKINLDATTATIAASKVNIEGATIFTSGRLSSTSLDAAYDAAGSAAAAQTAAISAAAIDATNKVNAANAQEQLIYIQAVSGTSSMSGTTTWVTATGESVTADTQGLTPTWTTKRPTYRSNYPVLFVATQRQTVGGTVTCTTPMIDETTTASQVSSAIESSTQVWYAVCETAAATTAKVATISPATTAFTLKEGVMVNVKFTATNSGKAVNLTLNVNETGAKAIKYIYNGSLSTIPNVSYLKVNQTYTFYYDGTYWVVQMIYNTNTTYNLGNNLYYNIVVAKSAITAETVIVGDSSGYAQAASGVTFDVSYPILWTMARIAANGTNYSNLYTSIYDRNLKTNYSSFEGTANAVVYLVGTVSGNTFTIDSSVLTSTVPEEEDGLVYIPIGRHGNQYAYADKPECFFFECPTTPSLYAFLDGRFRQVTPTEVVATQNVYIQASDVLAEITKPTEWVSYAGESVYDPNESPIWTGKYPTYNSTYPITLIARQTKRLDGTVTCTTPMIDDTTTVIDGGHIVTGTIDASRVNVVGLNAGNITAGKLDAARIDANSITLGQLSTEARNAIADAATTATGYLSYANGALTIGAQGNTTKARLTNSKFSFMGGAGGNSELAYIGQNPDTNAWETVLDQARVSDMLFFGNFAWIKRENGNMSLKWVG